MRFKKFVSLLVAVCLGAGSMISAGAIENTDLKAADVSANKTIDVDDALLTLQYSVAKIRKFPTHDFEKTFLEIYSRTAKVFPSNTASKRFLLGLITLQRKIQFPSCLRLLRSSEAFPILQAEIQNTSKKHISYFSVMIIHQSIRL